MTNLSYLRRIKAELERLNRGGIIQIFLPYHLYFDLTDQKSLDLDKYKGVRYIPFSGYVGGESPMDTRELIVRANKAGIKVSVIPALPEDEGFILELMDRRLRSSDL